MRTLADAGKELATMDPGESLWQAGAGPRASAAARSTDGSDAIYARPASPRRDYTSSGIPQPSSVATLGSRSRR